MVRVKIISTEVKPLRIPVCIIAMVLLAGCSSTQLQQGLGLTPQTEQSLHRLLIPAQKAYAERHWAEAEKLYSRLLKRIPGNASWQYRLANTLAHQGDYANAIAGYRSSLQLDASSVQTRLNLATTYLLGAHASSMQALETPGIDDYDKAVMQERLQLLESLLD